MPLQKVLLTADGYGLPSYTFARSSSAYEINALGVLALKTTDKLRIDYLDLDNDGERETPSIVVEPPSTNSFLRSNEFSNAAWTKTAATVEANVGAAPDLSTGADLLVPSTAVADHRVGQGVTLAASTDHTMSVYATPAGYNFISLAMINSSGNAVARAHYALSSSGAVVDSGAAGAATHRYSYIDRIRPGVYRCTLVGSLSTSTGVEGRIHVTQTSSQMAATWAGAGSSGALGVLLWGAQIEGARGAETSLIATGAAAVSRATDVVYFAFGYRPQAMSGLIDFIDGEAVGDFRVVYEIGNAAGDGNQLVVSRQTDGSYLLFHGTYAPLWAYVSSTVNISPSPGNRVRIRWDIDETGAVLIGAMKDTGSGFGAETVGSRSAALPLQTQWGLTATDGQRFYLSHPGAFGSGKGHYIDVKVAAESGMTMAELVSLAPFWVIDGVAIPVAQDSVREERGEIGDRGRAFDGTMRETIRNRLGSWSGETVPLTAGDRARVLQALENSTQPQQSYGVMCRTSTGQLPAVHTRVTGESLIQSSTQRRWALSFVAEQSS